MAKQNEIRVIKIDSQSRTVTEVTIAPTLEDFYKTLSGVKKVDMIEMCCRGIGGKNNHFMYVDEEGTFNDNSVFRIKGDPQPYYCGNGIVLAMKQGEDVSATLPLETITALVEFPPAGTSWKVS